MVFRGLPRASWKFLFFRGLPRASWKFFALHRYLLRWPVTETFIDR
jgi:hypothetical protein